jgi:response regulator RpfG family c-di-GMP phosphodiesterase
MTHAPSTAIKPHKTYRVILVDDDDVSLTIMRRGLTQNANYEGVHGAMRREITCDNAAEVTHKINFVIDAFTSAKVALEHITHNDCDLLITAQALPDMDGTQLLAEFLKIRPKAARILISNKPDKPLISQAINEVQVHSLLCIYWNTDEAKSDISRQALEVQRLKIAVMQVLTSRELVLENQRLASMNEKT